MHLACLVCVCVCVRLTCSKSELLIRNKFEINALKMYEQMTSRPWLNRLCALTLK